MKENHSNLWIVALLVVGVVAIVAIYGMVAITGFAAADTNGPQGASGSSSAKSLCKQEKKECKDVQEEVKEGCRDAEELCRDDCKSLKGKDAKKECRQACKADKQLCMENSRNAFEDCLSPDCADFFSCMSDAEVAKDICKEDARDAQQVCIDTCEAGEVLIEEVLVEALVEQTKVAPIEAISKVEVLEQALTELEDTDEGQEEMSCKQQCKGTKKSYMQDVCKPEFEAAVADCSLPFACELDCNAAEETCKETVRDDYKACKDSCEVDVVVVKDALLNQLAVEKQKQLSQPAALEVVAVQELAVLTEEVKGEVDDDGNEDDSAEKACKQACKSDKEDGILSCEIDGDLCLADCDAPAGECVYTPSPFGKLCRFEGCPIVGSFENCGIQCVPAGTCTQTYCENTVNTDACPHKWSTGGPVDCATDTDGCTNLPCCLGYLTSMEQVCGHYCTPEIIDVDICNQYVDCRTCGAQGCTWDGTSCNTGGIQAICGGKL